MKIFRLLLIITLLSPIFCLSQNFSITVNSTQLTADSLHLKEFDGKRDFKDITAVPAQSKCVLKTKGKLKPGFYQVYADTNLLFNFIISEEKKQALNVTVNDNGEVHFTNSTENENFLAYQQKINEYENGIIQLDRTFQEAQQTMPQYMLQTLVESLRQQFDTLMANEYAYKQQVIHDNPGTLLASQVKFSIEVNIPAEYYNNREMATFFYAEHAFDNYPFDDPRMANAPSTILKLQEYAAKIYYLNPNAAAGAADRLLTKAQSDTLTYMTFFDQLEKVLGTLTSPFWTEEIYLSMLNNVLNYNKLNKKRMNYYEQVYKLHNKNLPGSILPNFPLLMSDGTTTTLHDIKCDYMLLYFQNPDCPTCTEVRGKLAENEDLNRAIKSGKLKVLTVYFEKDEQLWRRYLANKANPDYLHAWDNTGAIDAGTLFDLRIIPYMFLLDKDKRVIKKDIYYNEISDYLQRYSIY